jgi:hypothetical protein
MTALYLSPAFVTLILGFPEATLDACAVVQTFSHSMQPLHFSGWKTSPNFFLEEVINASS